eukprot:Skav201768  [mRNA]  locus=scaffold2375:11755:14371:- [translate_table: standard]
MPPRQDASEVDARDAKTPDKWIKRHPEMLRNTGAHPFNSEPPLKHLQEAGWITPPSLHVVRNHGAVPQLSWSEHRLTITGVPKPVELSMDQIVSGEWGSVASIPVTFICAGNRRKEQNMTKKTVGPWFSFAHTSARLHWWPHDQMAEQHVGFLLASSHLRFVSFRTNPSSNLRSYVYDGTPYLKDHPGGASSILLAGGLEATEDFEAVHSTRAWEMLKDYYMGPLKSEGPNGPGASCLWSQLWTGFWQRLAAPLSLLPLGPAVFLNPRESQQLRLSEKIIVNHDTRIFRFKLPSPSMKLGLPTGMHMTLKAKVDGKPVMRAYTPMTDDNTLGHVDLLVKVYFKGVHPAFPEGGDLSRKKHVSQCQYLIAGLKKFRDHWDCWMLATVGTCVFLTSSSTLEMHSCSFLRRCHAMRLNPALPSKSQLAHPFPAAKLPSSHQKQNKQYRAISKCETSTKKE